MPTNNKEQPRRRHSAEAVGQHILLRIPDIPLRTEHSNAGGGIGVHSVPPFKQLVAGGHGKDEKNRDSIKIVFELTSR